MVKNLSETFIELSASFVGVMFAYIVLMVPIFYSTDWYSNLNKPPIAPSITSFQVIWMFIYLLLFVTFYLIWRMGFFNQDIKNTMFYLIAMIILPVIWSLIYFGFHVQLVGLILLIVAWILAALTIKNSWKISTRTTLLLIPYIIWITYLIMLNGWILILNY